MIDRLAAYHTQLRATGSSGYPNMSLFNPQHQQSPFPLGGTSEMLHNPYARLQVPRQRMYQQMPQQSLGLRRRYGQRTPAHMPVWS
jgi:hypothetical protein